jgi:hypothetical protein
MQYRIALDPQFELSVAEFVTALNTHRYAEEAFLSQEMVAMLIKTFELLLPHLTPKLINPLIH